MKRTEKLLSLVSLIFGAVAAFSSAILLSVSRTFASSAAARLTDLKASEMAPVLERLARAETEITPYSVGLWGSTLLLGVALFVVGIALYRNAPWARPASLFWSLLALAFIPVQLWLQLGVIQPRTQAALAQAMVEINRDLAAQLAGPMTSAQWAFAIARHLVIYAPLPVMLLVLHGRASAKGARLA